jgi:hypothetical protein
MQPVAGPRGPAGDVTAAVANSEATVAKVLDGHPNRIQTIAEEFQASVDDRSPRYKGEAHTDAPSQACTNLHHFPVDCALGKEGKERLVSEAR